MSETPMAAKTGRALLPLLLAGVALTACGDSSGATKSFDSVRTLAKALGCSGVALEQEATGIKEQGHCQLDDPP
jgi:hypothetical protein